MSGNKCFVCTGEIQSGSSKRDNNSSEENSILLCKILELPVNKTKKFSGRKVSYCRLCLNKILNIGDMLEELERLEKKVLDEKYSIELQLKEKDKSKQQDSSDQLRGQIVKQLRATSIESMLGKIRKKRVGQRRSPGGSCRVRIMESVTIPNIPCEATIEQISPDDVQTTGNNVFALEDSQSQLVDKHSFLPNSQSLMMMRMTSDYSETQLVDMTSQEPLTANISESFCVLEDGECDIKYEVRSDEDMTTDSLHSGLEHLDFPHQIELIPEISAKLEIDDLPCVTKFSDAQQTTSTTNEHEETPSHKNFICGTCGAGFVSYNQLRTHDRVHSNSVNGCSTVKNNRRKGGKSRQNNQLRIHDRVLKGVNESSTVKTIHRRKVKSRHNTTNLFPSLRPKKCEECGKVLGTKDTWTKHVMAFHRGQYKFKCTLCNYGSQRSDRLLRHIKHVHPVNNDELK